MSSKKTKAKLLPEFDRGHLSGVMAMLAAADEELAGYDDTTKEGKQIGKISALIIQAQWKLRRLCGFDI